MSSVSREKFSLILQDAKEIAPLVRHFTFVRQDGQPFEFTPGQFINLFFESQGELIQRSYSLASIPGESGNIEMALSYVSNGKASDFIFGLKPGDAILASGPFGRLTLREEKPKRYILVATGTGVTPYRSMLPELSKRIREDGVEVIIMQGARSPLDQLYLNDFLHYAERHPEFTFMACCSRALSDPQQPYEYKGYVQDHFDSLNLNPEQDMIFLCGNPHMIDAAYLKLSTMGFPAASVRREKYVFSH